MKSSETLVTIKVSVETWIATALLHCDNPQRGDFTINEIVERALKENLNGRLRPGVRIHATLHCVANFAPNPARYRMLFSTGRSTRRLFRPGDSYDPGREGGKILPEVVEVPEEYRYLLDWYHSEYAGIGSKQAPKSSILALRGLGRDIWDGEDADSYVARLREGWK